MTEHSPSSHLFRHKPRFENHLQLLLAKQRQQSKNHSPASIAGLFDAIDYSTLNAGKRIRAMLVYLSAECCGWQLQSNSNAATASADPELIDIAAASIELIHCYSLIHDDLPAMDDDDLRRGKPSCHIAFGEANAILAGDALQAMAFDILSRAEVGNSDKRLALIANLSAAAGGNGMVGGQFYDLACTDQSITLQQLERLHYLKTGALIEAAAVMGAICADATPEAITSLRSYARAIGLAFQIRDDILDLEGDPSETGKARGADVDANKSTFPALIGIDAAKGRAQALRDAAVAALQPFDAELAHPLLALADFFIYRQQ